MYRACNGLRPSRFYDEAADVEGLVHHLAVLCAIASTDEQVAASLRRWEDCRAGLLAGTVPYAELEHLQIFFETILPDARGAQAINVARRTHIPFGRFSVAWRHPRVTDLRWITVRY